MVTAGTPPTGRRPRLVVLSSDGPHHRYLAWRLSTAFDVVAVVVEPAAEQVRRLRRRGRWIDWLAHRYHALRRRLTGLDGYRARYFAVPRRACADRGRPPTLRVASINDDRVLRVLDTASHDAVIVMGTSILRRATLRAAGRTVVNIHGGCLPQYRGNHCFFFAMYEGALDHVGSTIHFVDEGVDTGDVIEHVRPSLLASDDPERLYCRAERSAIERLVVLLDAWSRGHALPRLAQPRGRDHIRTRDRTPLHDALFYALRLPAIRRRLRERLGRAT